MIWLQGPQTCAACGYTQVTRFPTCCLTDGSPIHERFQCGACGEMTARLSGTATLLSPDSPLAQSLNEDETLEALTIGLLRSSQSLAQLSARRS